MLRLITSLCLAAVLLAPCAVLPDEPKKPQDAPAPSTERVRDAARRGLAFLERDAATWRKDRQCATCHHGTMTVWAYAEAQRQGYAVAPEVVADTVKWTKDRLLDGLDKARDPRPGYKMVRTPALYLGLMARCVPGQNLVSADELRRIGGHLLKHQEEDGSWSWASAPAQNRPPPVFESDEVSTRLACLVMEPAASAEAATLALVRTSREKGTTWLAKRASDDTTQAAALRLLCRTLSADAAGTRQAALEGLLRLQRPDGGWGQTPGMPSDAYSTGQTLYSLGVAGVDPARPEVRRGVAFLVAHQRPDGSWPMTPRANPGATPSKNVTPITYFGSAWATLGLMRSVPQSSPAGGSGPGRR